MKKTSLCVGFSEYLVDLVLSTVRNGKYKVSRKIDLQMDFFLSLVSTFQQNCFGFSSLH